MENRKSALLKQSLLITFVAVCMVMAILALSIAFDEARASNGAGQHFAASREATSTSFAASPSMTPLPTQAAS